MSKPSSTADTPEKTEKATTNQPKDLAVVMDSAFKKNELEEEAAEEETQREVEVEIRPPDGYTMSSVYPPQPCERCVRTNKTCKGVAGARCEHCRNLHQKCSNSTGPPRGRHAVGHFTAHASESGSGVPRPKRKAASKPAAAKSRDAEEEQDELEDDDEEQPNSKKQRRVAPSTAPPGTRGARLKAQISELESSIKRLQANVSKEISKMQQTIQALTNEVRDLE